VGSARRGGPPWREHPAVVRKRKIIAESRFAY
jgi:hypothetical protein